MYISKRDFDIFRLLRWCRYVSKPMLESVFGANQIACLLRLEIVTHHQSSDSIVLTKKGNQFLDQLDDSLPKKIQPAYRASDTLRRLRRSRIMLTAYYAGLSIFHLKPIEISDEDGFCLSSVTKEKGENMWGSSRIAGLMTIGTTSFAVHYVCPNIGRITLSHELNMLSIGSAPLGRSRMAFLFVGETYEEVIQELLAERPTPKKKTPTTLIYYKDAFERNVLPVHLLCCGPLGALQLQIMRKHDHGKQLAKLTLGDAFIEPALDDDCDAVYQEFPFYVAVDMNLSRLDRACARGFVYILALEEQATSVLIPRYGQTGKAKIYGIPPNVIEQFFGYEIPYYTPPAELYKGKEGSVFYAPLISTRKKSLDHDGEVRVQTGAQDEKVDGSEQA